MAVVACRECREDVSALAKCCPSKASKLTMKKAVGLILTIGVAFVTGTAQADIFRCSGPDGRTVYQEAPCSSGTQKKIDDSQVKAKQKIDSGGSEEQEEAKKVKSLKWCIADSQCDAAIYVMYLRGMRKFVVVDTFGAPSSVQNIGGEEIHYFNVPTSEGRKRARLQVIYSFGKVDRVSAF